MNVKKSLLLTAAVSGATLAGVASVGAASAATDNSATDKISIVDKLAEKFNLDKGEVQKVFDENRSAHQAERQQKMEDRLTQAVKDGKITEDQKTQLLAKHKELKTYMESLKDKTHEERHELMKQKFTELKKWAEENNIPSEYMRFAVKAHGHGGPKGDMKMHIEAGGGN